MAMWSGGKVKREFRFLHGLENTSGGRIGLGVVNFFWNERCAMKSHIQFLARTSLIIVAFIFVGCSGGDNHEKVVDDVFKQMDRMATAMGSVTDKASAEKAVTDLKSVAEEMKKLGERAKKLGEPAAELKTKLEARMTAKQAELQQKMAGMQQSMAKAGPEAGMVLMKGMMEIAPAMEEAGKLFQGADKK